MVKVYSVKPAAAGFGLYDLTPDCGEFPGADLDSYVDHCRTDAGLEPVDVSDIDGRVQGQCGTLLGWRAADGSVSYECAVECEG
jgi:hypothetical protein